MNFVDPFNLINELSDAVEIRKMIDSICKHKTISRCNLFAKTCDYSCLFSYHCKLLYESGWRDCTNKIVLTEEEYNKLKNK